MSDHSTATLEPTGSGGSTADEVPGLAYLFAGMVAGAGVIHLAMVPSHAGGESMLDPIGFAVFGWLQLGLAAVVLARRPTRLVYEISLLINATALGLWVWSRTSGLPWGSHAGIAEEVTAIDTVCAALELGAIAVALTLILVPKGIKISATVAAVGGVAMLALASVVIVSPEAADHGHSESASGTGSVAAASGGHAHGGAATSTASMVDEMALVDQTRCDMAFNPVGFWDEANVMGIDTYAGGAMAAHSEEASILGEVTDPLPLGGRGSQVVDDLISLTSQSEDEAVAGALVAKLADASDEDYAAWQSWVASSNAAGHGHDASSSTSGDDNGGHGGHVGPQPWKAMTDQSQCDQLADELELARETALKYPTAADATAAGWRKVTPYVPGIAAHYMNFALVDGKFAVDEPEMILYDGEGPDAHVVGLSYYIILNGPVAPTQGFTGDNDHSHRHVGLCIKGGITVGPSTMSKEECEAMGGRKGDGSGGWMSHAWVVPGCESPWGVFSGASPTLDYNLKIESGKNDGACSASKASGRYDLSPGERPATAAATGDESADGGN